MGSRVRLGVALLLEPPVADEVDGLRRALGDPGLEHIPAHLTLVPPVNVPRSRLGEALALLRKAASSAGRPLRLALGPAASFWPDNPVIYLEVGGDLERLRQLRDAVFVPPLERPLTWPWVPHVTLADSVDPKRIEPALEAMGAYARVAEVDRVVLLEERAGRRWSALADATFAPVARVGTGGLAVELYQSRLLGPEATGLLEAAAPSDAGVLHAGVGIGWTGQASLALAAWRQDGLVGVAWAWADDGGGHVSVAVRPDARHQGIGSLLLAHLESRLRLAGWRYAELDALGPPGFYASRSGWARPRQSWP